MLKQSFFILLFTLAYCALYAQTEVDTLAVIQSLQKELNFKGDTEILYYKQAENGAAVSVFKIKSKNTKYHKGIIKFFKDCFAKKETHFFSAPYPKYYIPEHFRHVFVPVRKYKGEYYFYRPCDFLFAFQLTDTYIAPGFMDGAAAFPFVEFIKDHINSIYVKTGFEPKEWSIDIVDGAKKIYRVKINNDENGSYYTPLDNIVNLPIIGENCNGKGAVFEKYLDDYTPPKPADIILIDELMVIDTDLELDK